jgi:hypothetical protein
MRVLGMLALIVVGAVAVLGVVLGARSISDVKRYIQMRRM